MTFRRGGASGSAHPLCHVGGKAARGQHGLDGKGWERVHGTHGDTQGWDQIAPGGDLSPEAQPSPGQGLRKGRGKERRPRAYGCRGQFRWGPLNVRGLWQSRE